jgi:hypothetical protein
MSDNEPKTKRSPITPEVLRELHALAHAEGVDSEKFFDVQDRLETIFSSMDELSKGLADSAAAASTHREAITELLGVAERNQMAATIAEIKFRYRQLIDGVEAVARALKDESQ